MGAGLPAAQSPRSSYLALWQVGESCAYLVPIVNRGPVAAHYDPEITSRRILSQLDGTADSPWSPDGRKLAFVYRESTGYNLAPGPRLHIVHYEDWAER